MLQLAALGVHLLTQCTQSWPQRDGAVDPALTSSKTPWWLTGARQGRAGTERSGRRALPRASIGGSVSLCSHLWDGLARGVVGP